MFADFFQQNLMWFGLLFAMFAMLIIDIKRNSLGGFKKVSPSEVPLLQRDPTLIIDVSKSAEFKAGHINDSINIPSTEFTAEHGQISTVDKSTNVIIVDQTGMSSGAFAKKLKDAGFLNTFVLDGGILNWRKENFPIATN